jgi:hypothetical protein
MPEPRIKAMRTPTWWQSRAKIINSIAMGAMEMSAQTIHPVCM